MIMSESALTKKQLKRGSLFATIICLVVLVIAIFTTIIVNKEVMEKLDKKQQEEINGMCREIEMLLYTIDNDINYITQNKLAVDFLTNPTESGKQYLISLLSLMASPNLKYDQLRILDNKGMERLRINTHKNGSISVVPNNMLQNKANRYYFEDTMKLDREATFTSKFDLNIENSVLDRPLKPMIRYAQQIRDKNGNILGIGILNYLGNNIINRVASLNIHQGDSVYLVNNSGDYLLADDHELEWGWMKPNGDKALFAQDYPKVWDSIKTKKKGLVKGTQGNFYIKSFTTQRSERNNHSLGEQIYLIMKVPKAVIYKTTKLYAIPILIGILLIIPILIFLGMRIGAYQIRQKWLFDKLIENANHDTLTGLLNRRMAMERLETDIKLAHRNKTPLTVVFIDVNDLKSVNDEKGHDAGDILICGTANSINNVIRETDYAARIGGDEFIITFLDCDKSGATLVMERLESDFKARGVIAMNMPWSISWGASTLCEDDTAEELLIRADRLMYQDKAAFKKAKKNKNKLAK